MPIDHIASERDRLLREMRQADARMDHREGMRLLALFVPVAQQLRDIYEADAAR